MSTVLRKVIGLDNWQPRMVCHRWYQQHTVWLDAVPLRFQAKCLVLLPMYQAKPTLLESKVQQLLTGMLKVLELPAEQLCLAKVYSKNNPIEVADWQQVFTKVFAWRPEFILNMAKELTIFDGEQKLLHGNTKAIITTYHPIHLLKNPQDKAVAYKDLLELKRRLWE